MKQITSVRLAIVRIICMGMGLLAVDVYTQTITGTVTDSVTGSPIKNATVTLKTLGKATMTDNQGVFSLDAASIKYGDAHFNSNFDITLHGPIVRFVTSEKQSFVNISIFTLSGRKVAIVAKKTYSQGTHTIALPVSEIPLGLYLLQCRVGKSERVFVFSAYCPGIKKRHYSSVKETNSIAKMIAEPDTLLIIRYGYYAAMKNVSAYSGSHAIRLQPMPGTAIVPPGMQFIPSDTFQMGSQKEESNETPIHYVILSPFYIDSTEITQLDYYLLMDVKPWEAINLPFPPQKNSYHPAGGMNWYDAALYCNARSKRDNLDTIYSYSSLIGTPGKGCELSNVQISYDKFGYRLPTEAEWEYAYGTGKNTRFFWGPTGDSASYFSWFDVNSDNKSHKVAQKLPNPFNLYDMGGNLLEWVNDWESVNYSPEMQINPIGPGSSIIMLKIQRGGCWLSIGSFLRTTKRFSRGISQTEGVFGFRVALPKR